MGILPMSPNPRARCPCHIYPRTDATVWRKRGALSHSLLAGAGEGMVPALRHLRALIKIVDYSAATGTKGQKIGTTMSATAMQRKLSGRPIFTKSPNL